MVFLSCLSRLQRRLLKRWAESDGTGLNFRHVENLRHCAVGEAVRAEVPGGRIAIAVNGYIRLCTEKPDERCDYEYVLPVPGEVYVVELGAIVRSCRTRGVRPRGAPRRSSGPTTSRTPACRFATGGTEIAIGLRNAARRRSWSAYSRTTCPGRRTHKLAIGNAREEIVWMQRLPCCRSLRMEGQRRSGPGQHYARRAT